jgi:hypothetical protein
MEGDEEELVNGLLGDAEYEHGEAMGGGILYPADEVQVWGAAPREAHTAFRDWSEESKRRLDAQVPFRAARRAFAEALACRSAQPGAGGVHCWRQPGCRCELVMVSVGCVRVCVRAGPGNAAAANYRKRASIVDGCGRGAARASHSLLRRRPCATDGQVSLHSQYLILVLPSWRLS